MVNTMPIFFINLILMLFWAVITGNFSARNMIAGFLIGWVALWFTRSILGRPGYMMKPVKAATFTGYILAELLVASLRVAREILTPGLQATPGIVSMPLEIKTDIQILMLSNLIAAIPGTLPLDISDDRTKLYVHVMFLDDPDQAVRALKEKLEKRIIELTT